MSETIREQYDVISKNIHDTEELLRKQKSKLFMLQRIDCEHPNMEDDFGSVRCPDCKYTADDRFCPTSPDKKCEYRNSEYIEDCCVYCGHPE